MRNEQILRDMCHAIGLNVHQAHKAFDTELHRNVFSESDKYRERIEVTAARHSGMIEVHFITHAYTNARAIRWIVKPKGIEWCWKYVLTPKRDRWKVAAEFKKEMNWSYE